MSLKPIVKAINNSDGDGELEKKGMVGVRVLIESIFLISPCMPFLLLEHRSTKAISVDLNNFAFKNCSVDVKKVTLQPH